MTKITSKKSQKTKYNKTYVLTFPSQEKLENFLNERDIHKSSEESMRKIANSYLKAARKWVKQFTKKSEVNIYLNSSKDPESLVFNKLDKDEYKLVKKTFGVS